MTESTNKKRSSFNALDVTIVLLVFLLILGAVGRILLDRNNSKGLEQRQISFTCAMPAIKADTMKVGATLYTESGHTLGSIVSVDSYVQEEDNASSDPYVLVIGRLSVRGYEQKNGVFCTSDGEELRINTVLPLQNGQNVHFYINDIVKNGQ